MTDRPFVHLHCHSHYSLLDGASRIPELVSRAKELRMNAIALTDHGNLYGAIELYQECKSAGLNPIVGYEAYVAPGKRTERSASRRGDAAYHLTLLARNRTGFKNLIKMASVAFLEGYHYVPRIDKDLLEAHKEGIVCLSGCASGEFSESILKDQMDEARQLAEWYARIFGRHFFVEIQNNGLDIQRRCAEGAIDIAKRLGLPLVATSDAHYLCQADSAAHDVLLCINTGKMRSEVNRMRYEGDQFYVRPPDEMYRLFPGHEDAVRRSQEIADDCHLELELNARHFPVFVPPDGKTPEAYLRELCEGGVRQRYGDQVTQAVLDRLDHELGIICRMGYAGYFLIVSDFVRFAVENRIPASARGSAVGALVSYLLRLSHVDPLEYDLLFERFLDPNRSEAPDIDIDLCQDRREEVLTYVRRKYGEASVAQIATFGTLAARAAVKDVGRVLGFPIEQVNQLTKTIPERLNITLDDALSESADLRSLYETDPRVKELLDISRRLEGTNRNAGTHAAGVVIANGPLTDYVPLQRVISKGDDAGDRRDEVITTTQWVMGDLEKVGLLKMDFLGLRTLTLLENAVRLIENTRGERIDVYRLPGDDPETYALLQRGDAKGVFQFESDGIRDLLKRIKPDNIRDLMACSAIYRPGPLQGGMVDAYINCKHGRERPVYVHPVMEEILSETYGVMVFQEQIMRILNRLGGIELASAYACIKAISKKKQDVIDQRRIDFHRGARERGLDEATADDIFAKIIYFGGYGFNKSHTCAYALISYQAAYLKAHYRTEFMAALLSSVISAREVLVEHIADARRVGVPVLPPDVNASDGDFTVREGKIVFGLTAIKGVGRGAAAEVVRARTENGQFKDLFDFCERIDSKIVTKMALEKLVKAGAFDSLGVHRALALHVLPRALQAASDRQDDKKIGQGHLFDGFNGTDKAVNGPAEDMPDVPAWSESEKLRYEKEVLDFYFSSHPLAQQEKELRRFASHTVEQMKALAAGEEVTVGGMLTQLRFMNTKKARNGNSRYLRCKVEDFTGSAECVMWPDDFVRYKETVAEDTPCFVRGTVERNREEPGLVLSRIFTVAQATKELATKLWLRLSLPEHGPRHIDLLAELLKRAPGRCPVFLAVSDPRGKTCVLRLGQDLSINPSAFPLDELEEVLGPGGVKLE
jgi:DNA polymerase III subunit alpha